MLTVAGGKTATAERGRRQRQKRAKGPVATVAAVANRLGMDGWELVEVVNQAHSIYRLSFELAYVMEDEEDGQQPPRTREVARHSG
jgi:hypothetical protein